MMKFGCHDFLNAQPILYPITEGLMTPPFELHLASPSELAEKLKSGELDMALIPSIEYARIPNLKIVKGFSIASFGKVKTVILFSKKKILEIESIAADARSRTSVALLKIMLLEYYGKNVRFVQRKRIAEVPKNADAALLIGDEALKLDPDEYNLYDVSTMWHSFTGKSFVFALLCVRDHLGAGANADEAVEFLIKAKEAGMDKLDDICAKAAAVQGIPMDELRRYLTDCIRYDFDEDDAEGFLHFLNLAAKHHLIDQAPPLRFYGEPDPEPPEEPPQENTQP
ncbi:MAG: menaquinone biosynthesis protein [Nitrospinota bacterium]